MPESVDTGNEPEITFDDLLSDSNPDEKDEIIESENKLDTKSSKSDKDKEDDEQTDDKTSETKDENEEELDLKDSDDEELLFHDVPRRKEILEKFPELFKKFPGLEHAIYRNKAYSEIFPTLADAKEAKQAAEYFNNIAGVISSGSITEVLSEVKQTNPEAFKKITTNYLKTLHSVDQDAYVGVVSSVMSSALSDAFEAGKGLGESDEGKNLRAAAQIINRYIFKTNDIKTNANTADNKPDPDRERLTQERQNFETERFKSAITDVSTRIETTVKSAIEKKIDERDQMTDYVKSRAVDDVIKLLDRELRGDRRYQAIIDRFWQDARKNNYSEDSKKKIRDAVISKAKTVLPDIIRKVRSDALKGVATRSKTAAESKDNRPVARGKVATSDGGNGKVSQLKEKAKTFKGSTLDFLNQD